MLDYREFRPQPPLARFVECFWTLAGATPAVPERILPDGCMEIILNSAEPFRRYHARGAGVPQPLRMLAGQMDHHIVVAPGRRVDLFGIRFHPAGARVFLRQPMSELAGHLLPLDAVARDLDADLAGTLDMPAPTRVPRIEALLLRRLGEATAAPDRAVDAAVGELLRAEGNVSVDALAASAGLSARQLERRFLSAVGLGPKRLARILRFQRVFRAVSNSGETTPRAAQDQRPSWAAVAVDCGYYDQAHLIRDFHLFAGQAPSLLFAADAALTRYFTRERRPARC